MTRAIVQMSAVFKYKVLFAMIFLAYWQSACQLYFSIEMYSVLIGQSVSHDYDQLKFSSIPQTAILKELKKKVLFCVQYAGKPWN